MDERLHTSIPEERRLKITNNFYYYSCYMMPCFSSVSNPRSKKSKRHMKKFPQNLKDPYNRSNYRMSTRIEPQGYISVH